MGNKVHLPRWCPTCLTTELAGNPEFFKCGYSEVEERQCSRASEFVTELRGESERNYRWAYQFLLVLAKRKLAEANATRGNPKNWPAGQEWDDLVGTSQSIFLRQARDEAGIDHDEFLKGLREGKYCVDDLYSHECPQLLEDSDKEEPEKRCCLCHMDDYDAYWTCDKHFFEFSRRRVRETIDATCPCKECVENKKT